MSTPLARLTHNTARRQTHTCVFQSCLENMHPLPHLSPLLACSQEIASPLCRNPTAERSPGASSTLFCYSFRRQTPQVQAHYETFLLSGWWMWSIQTSQATNYSQVLTLWSVYILLLSGWGSDLPRCQLELHLWDGLQFFIASLQPVYIYPGPANLFNSKTALSFHLLDCDHNLL